MRSGIRATFFVVHAIASLLTAVGIAEGGSLSPFQLPRPIASSEFEQIMKAAEIPQSERPAVDAAFDAYVEEWQRLRDRMLRPLGDDVDRLETKTRAEMMARSTRQAGVEQTPDQARAEAEEMKRISDAAEAACAELRARACQAYARIEQLDARLLAALRAGPRSDHQTRVIDVFAQRREQKLVGAELRFAYPRPSGPMVVRLPAAPTNLDPAVAAAFDERMARLERETLRLSKRVADSALANGDATKAPHEATESLIGLRLKAIDELGALLPEGARVRWVESARQRMLRDVISDARVPSAAVTDAIGDRMDAAARQRMERWRSERRVIEDELLLGEHGWKYFMEHAEALKHLDKQALSDLSESTHTPDLTDVTFVHAASRRASWEADDEEDAGDEDEFLSSRSRRARARQEADDESADGTRHGAVPPAAPDTPPVQPRILRPPQVDRIRDALGITAEQRATWDALASDMLEASTKLHDEHSGASLNPSQDPQEAVNATLRLGAYRAEQQSLEDRWFDSIAAAFSGLSRDALADQRSRRALQRLHELGGAARTVTMMIADRSAAGDLDAAVDRLPADIRSRIASQVMAWRDRHARDLQANIDAGESFLRASSKLTANMESDQEPDAEAVRVQRTFLADARKRADRAKIADQEALQAMAATLTPEGAAMLRRAIKAQKYPEVYRALDRVDRTIDRVMSLPNLTAAQLTTLGTEADTFRVRSDDVADRAIEALARCDAASADMMATHANPQEFDSSSFETILGNIRRSELRNADLDYDRSELAARTLRHMRAALSPEQAQAAGLAER